MLIVVLVFMAMLAGALVCALLLTRTGPTPAPVQSGPDVEPMKAALERRLREGCDLGL